LAAHSFALKAAEAVECAGEQSNYWQMHDAFFDHPDQLTTAGVGLRARSLGLDIAAFDDCVNRRIESTVLADLAEGRRLGVRATPTFLLGISRLDGTLNIVNRIEGAQPYAVFERAIQDALSLVSAHS